MSGNLPVPTDPKKQKFAFRLTDNPEARMTFIEHLRELRTRLVRSGIAVFVGLIICYALSDHIITLLAEPLAALHGQEEISSTPVPIEAAEELEQTDSGLEKTKAVWVTLNPVEPVIVKLKIALYGGLLLTFPYLLYHICAFVFPGLTPKEKKLARVLIMGSSFLAFAGVALAYYLVFPLIMPYLTTFAPEFIEVQLRMNETMSLLLLGFVGFAVAFQFPMIVLVLVYMGLLSPESLRKHWRGAVVGLCAVSMILTPPDPFSMLIMAGPLVLLYFISVLLSYLVVRRKREAEAA